MTAITEPAQGRVPPTFMELIDQATPGESRLIMCIQCGTCGGSCPSGPDMDHTPRQLFAMVRAEMMDEVLASNTPWYCVSCYYCMVRCPQEVHITDLMYTFKSMAIKAGKYEESAGADLAGGFVGYVENYGRSFEFGLATRQYLRHQPLKLLGKAQMGLGMLTKGRMELTPHKIDGLSQLQAILDRAKAIEEEVAL